MQGTAAGTRTASDLSGADIGTAITVSTLDWSITGRLHEVSHETDLVELDYVDSFRRFVPGWRRLSLTIGPWSGEVPPDAAVNTL